jgi:ABC-type Fe3+/spermidine/putrescine transport system ATPase subunit
MENPEKTTSTEIEKHITSPVARLMQVVAYPAAAVIAYFIGQTNIRSNAYKNLARHGMFNDLQKDERNAILKMAASIKADPTIQGATELEKIHESYRTAVKGRFESLNIRTMREQWRGLHRNQKIEAMAFAASTAGIVLGATLTAADHLGQVQKMVLQEKSPNDQDIEHSK